LLSAFFWSYTLCQLVVGSLVDRYNVKWVYAAGFFLWSLAMASTGLVANFAGLFAARLTLGIGESVFLPSVSKIMVARFPVEQSARVGPGMFEILARREAWGTSLGMFALGYVWIFLLTWLPTYLVNERGYTIKQMASLGSLPYWGMAATSLTGGWASDRLIRRGLTPTFVRKSFAVAGLLLCAVLMLAVPFAANPALSMGLLVAACVSL